MIENMITKIFKYLALPITCILGVMNVVANDQKEFYVSSSTGSDSNDGSENRPLRSISCSKIPKTGVRIRLKCGDVFYENIKLDGDDLMSYGEGPKPILSGWKTISKVKSKWEEGKLVNGKWIAQKGTHIWRLDMEQGGFVGRCGSQENYENNVGLIVDVETNTMHGHKCEFLYKEECKDPYKHAQRNTYLKNNFDFAQTSKYKEKPRPGDFKYLYMYLDHNPSRYEFKFSTYGHGIVAKNTTVKGIRIEGFSCHGITCGSNVTVSECEIDRIGGAQQIGYPRWARFGNGVEFYVSKNRQNGYIHNNVISRTFDCGTTIQGSKHPGAVAENIIFENNIIRNCRQAFEYFLNNNDKEKGIIYDCVRCYFRNNTCIDSGENGFDSPEMRDTHILSYQKNSAASIVIEGNVFIGGKGLYTASNPELIELGRNDYYYDTPFVLWTSGSADDVQMYSDDKLKSSKVDKHIKNISFQRFSPSQLNVIKNKYK